MVHVTLQLIEGLERGLMFCDLPTPVTIGREDENTVRLNDERVSRFHAKIQEDGGQLILTDLESTNGTRLNGHPIQMRVLRVGDQISIGRCLLVFGSPGEISARAEELNGRKSVADATDRTSFEHGSHHEGSLFDSTNRRHDFIPKSDDEPNLALFPNGPPELPHGMRPLQRAQISDYLGYCHEQIRRLLHSAAEEGDDDHAMRIGWEDWQRVLRLEMELAIAMKKVADPDA
jgi:hypothetical protein